MRCVVCKPHVFFSISLFYSDLVVHNRNISIICVFLSVINVQLHILIFEMILYESKSPALFPTIVQSLPGELPRVKPSLVDERDVECTACVVDSAGVYNTR